MSEQIENARKALDGAWKTPRGEEFVPANALHVLIKYAERLEADFDGAVSRIGIKRTCAEEQRTRAERAEMYLRLEREAARQNLDRAVRAEAKIAAVIREYAYQENGQWKIDPEDGQRLLDALLTGEKES